MDLCQPSCDELVSFKFSQQAALTQDIVWPEWQVVNGQRVMVPNGVTEETLKLAQINAKTKFSAPGGIDVQLPAGDPLKEQIQNLSQQPGMTWLNDLSQRKDVNWQAIKLAKDNWNYDQEGLTQAGALIIVLIVTYLTLGTGTELAGTVTEGAAAGSSTTAVGGTTLATIGTVATKIAQSRIISVRFSTKSERK